MLLQKNKEKSNILVEEWAKEMNREFTETKCMLRKEAGKGQDAGQFQESRQQERRGSCLGSKRSLGCVCTNCFLVCHSA